MITRKTLFLTLAALLVGFAVVSPAHASTCTPLTMSITPGTSEELQPVTIANSVTNCSASAQRVKINVNFTADTNSCGDYSESFSFNISLRPHQSRTVSFVFPAPLCEGTYTVTEASSNGGSATASLTVN